MSTYWLGNPNQDDKKVSGTKLDFMVNNPRVSPLIKIASATGEINAIYVPAGTIVKKVGVIAKVAVAGGSGDVDVGDGTTADLYVDGLSALAANVIKWAGAEGTGAADPHGGKYYSAADWIKVKVNGTPETGHIHVIAYFDVDDTEIIDW